MANQNALRVTISIMYVVAMIISLADVAEANYKNAPMNGIMFGKRGPSGKKSDFVTGILIKLVINELLKQLFVSTTLS